MKRRVMQLLFTVGLLLTLAAGTLWVRSFWVMESIRTEGTYWRDGGDHAAGLNAAVHFNNRFVVVAWTQWRRPHWILEHPREQPVAIRRYSKPTQPVSLGRTGPDTIWRRMGFLNDRIEGSNIYTRIVAVPPWFIVLSGAAFTGLIALPLMRMRRTRLRRAAGLCPTCGYDLRGADHERCPECGDAVPAKALLAV